LLLVGITLLFITTLSSSAQGETSPLITSTRNFFNTDTGDFIENIETSLPNASSLLRLDTNECPNEIAIYVHGVWATKEIAKEQTERIDLSLNNLNSHIPLIGFSWDSDTPFSLVDPSTSQQGWDTAKIIANKNGPILAQFIIDYKENCPNSDVRIIAHSLGARVIFSALQSFLNDDQAIVTNDNNTDFKIIKSVHLLGAAVDDEQVSMSQLDCISNVPSLTCSGKAIESEVEHFYNLFNPQDNMIAPTFFGTIPSVYKFNEDDEALGSFGADNIANTPSNYNQTNVVGHIIVDIDANGDGNCDLPILWFGFEGCTIFLLGDNHFGYMGYRPFNGQNVYDEGAIDVVVTDWRKQN
jgi:Alpha/beta hydrolase of unknown function (DUF900)